MDWTPVNWPASPGVVTSPTDGGEWPSITESSKSNASAYSVAVCERSLVLRREDSPKEALVVDSRKVGSIHVEGIGHHKDMVLDEIHATAILGTVVCPNGDSGNRSVVSRSYLVLCTDAAPVALLPGGHTIMEVRCARCIPYRAKAVANYQSTSAVGPIGQPVAPGVSREADESILPDVIAKRVERLIAGGGFYYCRTYDITHGQQWHAEHNNEGIWDTVDPLYCWNRAMIVNMLGATHLERADQWCTPLMQGSVCGPATVGKGYRVMLIGRRSCARPGTRYHHRGIDDEGHVANYVETEMLVLREDKEIVAAHTQIRGSIPAFWQQEGSTMKLDITRNARLSASAYDKHIQCILDRYGPRGCLFVNLLSAGKGQEQRLTDALKDIMEGSHFAEDGVFSIIDFDFHKMVKERDVDSVLDTIVSSGAAKALEFQWWQPSARMKQVGVIRTNCLDCLDRTNAGQLAFSCFILRKILTGFGVRCDDSNDPKKVLTTLWAEHGDQIAMHYTGTGSVLTELVTTGQNSWQNSIQQMLRSANRYVKNNFGEDRDRQSAIDASLALNLREPIKNNVGPGKTHSSPASKGVQSEKEAGGMLDTSDNVEEDSSELSSAGAADTAESPRLSIWVGTWNINASRAWNAEDLSSWFRLSYHHPSPGSGDHDDDKDSHLRDVALCCLGEAMEFVDLDATAIIKRGFKMMTSKFEGETEHEVRRAQFNRALCNIFDNYQKRQGIPRQDRVHYTEVQCITMVGLYISVWVKESLAREISHVHTKKIKGGLGGAHGNKGGVLLSMKLHNTLISMCSVHLEAGEKLMDIRNDQLHMITSEYRQQIREQYAIMGSIKRRVLFLLGDFNFRLNCDRDTAVDLLDKGDFERLAQYDQYYQGECTDSTLIECNEGKISDFMPTYKFEPETMQLAVNRCPSWCDRIFYQCTPHKALIIDTYQSHHKYISSDHKPVSATFELAVDLPTIRSPVRVKRRPARRSAPVAPTQQASRASNASSVPEVDLLSWVSEPEIKSRVVNTTTTPAVPSSNLTDDYFGPFESATPSSSEVGWKPNRLVEDDYVVVDDNFYACTSSNEGTVHDTREEEHKSPPSQSHSTVQEPPDLLL